MKQIAVLVLAGLALLLSSLPARAADRKDPALSVEALEQHKAAELELWHGMEAMSSRQAVLVAGEPSSYGVYTPRKDNRFLPGEPVHIYVEPVGHTIREEEGLYRVGLELDFTLLDASGRILGGQRAFDRLEMTSRRPVMEFMAHVTYDTKGLPAGEYTFETLLRDSFSERSLKVEMPIVLVGRPAPVPPGLPPGREEGMPESPGQ